MAKEEDFPQNSVKYSFDIGVKEETPEESIQAMNEAFSEKKENETGAKKTEETKRKPEEKKSASDKPFLVVDANPSKPKEAHLKKGEPMNEKKPSEETSSHPKKVKVLAKPQHHSRKKQHRKSSDTGVLVAGIVIAALVIIGLALFFMKLKEPLSQPSTSEVAAEVNGEPILLSTIEEKYKILPSEYKLFITKETLLNRTIDETLLLQDAEERGITVSDGEVLKLVQENLDSSGMTEEDFKANLELQGISYELFLDVFKKQEIINMLVEDIVLNDVEVSEEEIQVYFDENQAMFEQEEQVGARHILVCYEGALNCEQNRSKEEAFEVISDLLSQATPENFADLAMENSDGPSNVNGGDLGSFGKGRMVPEFEETAFATGLDEISDPVETDFGYHIILVYDKIGAESAEVEDVSDQITDVIKATKGAEVYEEYILGLREKATICNYLENWGECSDTGKQVVFKEESPSEPEVSLSADTDSFAQCLTEKGAILYAASWCPHCQKQIELFGESFQYLTHVECAVEGSPNQQTEVCSRARIAGYPTWDIGGERVQGFKTLEELATLSG